MTGSWLAAQASTRTYGAQGEATARSLSPLELVTSQVESAVVHGVEVGQTLWIVIEYSPEWVTGETAQIVEGQPGLSGEVTRLGERTGSYHRPHKQMSRGSW